MQCMAWFVDSVVPHGACQYRPAYDGVTSHARRFKLEAAYHSSHPPKGGLTITTYVNMERLNFLEAHCASWEGPLIVAAYLPLIAGGASDPDSTLRSLEEAFSKCAVEGVRLSKCRA